MTFRRTVARPARIGGRRLRREIRHLVAEVLAQLPDLSLREPRLRRNFINAILSTPRPVRVTRSSTASTTSTFNGFYDFDIVDAYQAVADQKDAPLHRSVEWRIRGHSQVRAISGRRP